jgi:hypothetical protein
VPVYTTATCLDPTQKLVYPTAGASLPQEPVTSPQVPVWSAASAGLGYEESDKAGAINLTEVKLAKITASDMFGFQINPAVGNRAGVITYVDPKGALERWNWDNPCQAVREGDIIVCVNGLANDLDAMMSQMKKDAVTLLVQRR